MKNPINKRLFREFKSDLGKYIAIFFMLIVTISFMSGFLIVADDMADGFVQDRTDSVVEDGQFAAEYELTQEQFDALNTDKVKIYKNYYADESVLDNVTLRIYKNRKNVDLVTVMEGSMAKGDNEIALERLFAESNNINIGDTITIADREYTVSGLVCMPDFTSLFKKNTDLIMDAISFGVGIVSDNTFDSLQDNNKTYSYVYKYSDINMTDDQKEAADTELKAALVSNNIKLTNFLAAEDNQSIYFIDDDMGSDIPMMKVFLYILIIIMAFVFAIVISSTIDSEAQVIGTLRANGYTKAEMVRHYMALPVIVTFISAVLGNILGYTAMPGPLSEMYYSSYSLPPLNVSFNLEALLLTTVVPIVIMIVINLAIIYRKLSISPLTFLRNDLSRKKNKKARKLPNFKFINRFRLRVIFQNAGNYIILLVGIFFASFILMFGVGLKPLINYYLDDMENSVVCDNQYVLRSQVNIPTGSDAEKVTMYTLNTYFKAADKNMDVTFYGIGEESKYYNDLDFSNEDEIYVADGLVKKMGLDKGDSLTFTDPYTDKEYDVEIKDTYSKPATFTVFMPQDKLNEMLGLEKGYYNCIFSDEDLKLDENAVLTVIHRDDMTRIGNQMLKSFGQMVPIFIFVAVIIYVVLMYVLTKIVIDKNACNISYMKVFGYQNNEINRLYLNGTTYTVIASLIITLPLVYVALKAGYNIALMKVAGYLDLYIAPVTYAEIVTIGIVTYLVINTFHIRKVRKIDLSLALKSRE